MNHELTFYDYLSHVRILGYDPPGSPIVTGSYYVRGWQNSVAIVVHNDNPLERINMDQLDGVFGSERAGAGTAPGGIPNTPVGRKRTFAAGVSWA